MRCPYCGAEAPENDPDRVARANADTPRHCEGCDRELPLRTAGSDTRKPPGPRDFRPVTSLVDKPVDPAMIDETPPARPKRIEELEDEGLEEEENGRRSRAGEELQESAPIGPDDLKGPVLESDRKIPDFGEARKIPARGAGRVVERERKAPEKESPTNEAWASDRWDSFRADVRSEAPPLPPKGGFWIRGLALLFDTVFLYFLSWATLAVISATTGFQDAIIANRAAIEQAIQAGPDALMEIINPLLAPYADTFRIVLGALMLASFLYRPLCHATWGKTFGKQLLGLRVVTTDGAPLGLGKAFLRYIGYMISIIPLAFGLLWVVFDPQKQGWHDRIAATYVIKERG